MHDQADELRQLVLRTAATSRIAATPPPPLIVVSGGKGGVGASTLAVNLTVILARLGRRAVLVDADFNQPDATALCNIKEADTVVDVLTGRRTVHEVLQPGPAGIQILPGAWAPDQLTNCSPMAQQRMLTELGRLGAHADVVIIDAGNKVDPVTERFWQAADLVLLVTTSESAAIMDSYAAIKVLAPRDSAAVPICTLVNKTIDSSAAREAAARIQQASLRFLNLEVSSGPDIPEDHEVMLAERAHRPFVLHSPSSSVCRALESVSDHLLGMLRVGKQGTLASRESQSLASHHAGVA